MDLNAIPKEWADTDTVSISVGELRKIVTEMNKAVWYYDQYWILSDQFDAYKRNWGPVVAAADGAIAQVKALDFANRVHFTVELLEAAVGVILYITKK